MKNIYLEFPYINEINSKIINRKEIDNKIYFNLDKTIIYYDDKNKTFNDIGYINNKKITDYLIDEDIWYCIDEDIENEDVVLSIDWNNRYNLMQQYSGIYVFKNYLKKIYQINTLDYVIDENGTYLDIEISYDDLENNFYKIDKILDLSNNFIDSAIDIEIKDLLVSNSSEIRNIEIDKIVKNEKNNTRIYLLCGNSLMKIYHNLYKKKESI